MATPPSLPSPSTSKTLPFSPLNTSNLPRVPGSASDAETSPSKPSAINSPGLFHSRSISSATRSQHQHKSHDGPFSPSVSLPILQPRPAPSGGTTHAGGIIPSASFFHPTRPAMPSPPPSPPLPHQRPSSSGSMSSYGGPSPGVRLSAIRTVSHRLSIGTESPTTSMEDLKAHPSIRAPSNKYSREPLLPLTTGGRKPGPSALPPVNTSTNPYGRGETSVSAGAGGRMRGSFEKVFKRRFSSDRSPVSSNPQVSPVTFDFKGTGDGSPVSQTHHKPRLTPLPGSATSLGMDHSFVAMPPPPDGGPPRAAVPVVDAATRKPVRRYQVHPSRNRFFLGGRILTGGDSPWAFVASLVTVFSIAGVWFGTTCVWWWRNESPAVAAVGAYMCLLSISSMFATAFRDPGILPRNLDPDPPYPATSSSDGSLRAPLPRDLKVRAGIVRTKYCPTCQTYRPPRSSHCKMCDNCVDGCDHHCQWVNNCVGRRNYTSFFTFLFSSVLTLVLVICTSAIHLYLLTTSRYGLSFHDAVRTSQGAGSATAFILSILIIWPVSALLSYHLRLLLLNVTTIEQIRNAAHKSLGGGPVPPNPFSHGNWRRNLMYVLCRPEGASWLDGRAAATEDRREINPGLVDEWPEDVERGGPERKGE